MLDHILSQQIVQKVGWTLVHFVWQAAAVAALLAMIFCALRKSAANLRYLAACLALILTVLLPIATIPLIPVSADSKATEVETLQPSSALIREANEKLSMIKGVGLEKVKRPEPIHTLFQKQYITEWLEQALPYIVMGWLAGVLALSVWHLGGWAQLQRLRRRRIKQVDATVHSRLRPLAQRLGVNRPVQLVESALVQVPTVVGWLRPMILLPASVLTGLSVEQLEALLAHELAHIKRLDYLVNMLQTVVEILGFYHPAVWWISHKIRLERENCCDDLAANLSGDKLCYAKALTVMEEIRSRQPAFAVAATGGGLVNRVRRLVGQDLERSSRAGWIPSLIVIPLIVLSIIPATSLLTARAQSSNQLNQSLLLATENGEVDKAESLIKQGADVNVKNQKRYTPLYSAVLNNDANMVEMLVINGADISCTPDRKFHPLDHAAMFENIDMARVLITHGAKSDVKNYLGWSPFRYAVHAGNKAMLELFVANGADVSDIHRAACLGDVDRVRSLLDQGMHVDLKDELGWTPLYWAALMGQKEVGQLLISREANVNITNKQGLTPLRMVASAGNLAGATLLIANGAKVDMTNRSETPLLGAAHRGNSAIIDLLLTHGADLTATDRRGRTALHRAAQQGHKNAVERLLAQGADVATKDNGGRTALDAAKAGNVAALEHLLRATDRDTKKSKDQTSKSTTINNRYRQVIELLKKHGTKDLVSATLSQNTDADPHIDIFFLPQNKSPFEAAILANDLEKVKQLIAQGADVNIRDSRGNTPLLQAVLMGRLSFVEVLISAGADINAKSPSGRIPLDVAKRRRRTDVVEVLTRAAQEQANVENKPSQDSSPFDSQEPKQLTSLHRAAAEGDLEWVKELLESGAAINAKNERGLTALHRAINRGKRQIVELLLDKGADVNAKDDKGFTPLFSAIGNRDYEMVKLLVDKGANVNVSANDGTTPLNNAVWIENMEVIECLLTGGADVNQKGYEGYTAYRSAAERGHRELVELFISKGVDISNIHGASCIGDLAQVKSYLDQGVDVNVKDELGWTPLIWAVSMSREDVVELLLAHGAEVKMETEDGIVPICNAASKKSKRAIELLIAHGADVNVSDGKGGTPLYWAAMYDNPAGIELLLAKGAKVDVRSKTSSFTPLHRASQWGHPEIVKMLIAHGADVNSKTKGGLTPLLMVPQQARIRALPGHNEVVELLLKSGADINARDNRGRTPLDLARQFGQTEIIKRLTEASEGQKTVEKKLSTDESRVDSKETEPLNSLHEALSGRNIAQLEAALSRGADINARDENGDTVLHLACRRGRLPLIRLLLYHGADVNAKNNDGKTPLDILSLKPPRLKTAELLIEKGASISTIHVAAFVGNLEKVKGFIEAGTDMDTKSEDGQTPLFTAVYGGHIEVVRFLLDKGAEVNEKDNRDNTPLRYAIWHFKNEIAKLLIDRGADIHDFALHWTAMVGNEEMAKLLVAKGVDVNVVMGERGISALAFCVDPGSSAIARLLVANGAKVTRIHFAALAGDLAKVKEFLENGADVSKKVGNTSVLHAASAGGNRQIVEIILSKGVDINERIRGGQTALHWAARSGSTEVTEFLIDKGLDINAKDFWKWTPLHYACSKNRADTVTALLARGADLTAREELDMTPLEVAEKEGHTEIVELLKKHGAKESDE